ncbi:MAG: hypothetical protein AB1410_04240 [Acidobacteriota bacterium]
MKRFLIFLIPAMILISIQSCKRKIAEIGVTPDVKFSDSPLTDFLFTEIEYSWKLKENFKGLKRNYWVFTHFSDRHKNMILQDDHLPPVKTTKWKKEMGEIKYKREIFIPRFIDEFDPSFKGEEIVKLTIGLHNPMNKHGKDKYTLLIKKIKILPPPYDTPEVIYESGWHNEERDVRLNKVWRWTEKEAVCSIDNPHRPAKLIIKGGVNKSVFKDQKVQINFNGKVLEEFIPETGDFEKRFELTTEDMGSADELKLVISTDKTFTPANLDPKSTDTRELGVMIFLIYFR